MPEPFLKMSGSDLRESGHATWSEDTKSISSAATFSHSAAFSPARADGRVLLEPRAHPKDVLLVEDEVLHARLRAHPHSVLPISPHMVEPARERAVHDVAAHPGRPRNLEDGDVRDELRERRAACPVRLRGVAPFSLALLGEASHDVRVLVVERHRQSGLGDGREDFEELSRVVPRKADGVVFVGGYLEGAGPGVRELRDAFRARSLAGGGVKRGVHDGEPLDRIDLVAQTLHRVDRVRIVEGHVHDRRDPSRGGGPGGVAQSPRCRPRSPRAPDRR